MKLTLDSLTREAFASLKPNTKDSYEAAWSRFAQASGVDSIEALGKLTPTAVEHVFDKMLKTYKPATVAQVLVALRFVESRAKRAGLVAGEATKGVRVKVGDNVPSWNVLQPGELEKLAATDDLKLGTMARAVVLAMALQGLRASELCKAKWGDVVTVGDKHQLKVMGKGQKYATMGLQKLVMEAALAWAGPHNIGPEHPFVRHYGDAPGHEPMPLNRKTVTALVRRLTKRHLGHPVTAHGLRATFISDVISRKGIEVARQLARHATINQSVRYSRWNVTEDDERVL